VLKKAGSCDPVLGCAKVSVASPFVVFSSPLSVCAMPRTGRPPHQRNLTGAVIDAADAAGRGYVTPQDLRRSFATIAARRIPDPAEAAY
jgi:hypothetical protein